MLAIDESSTHPMYLQAQEVHWWGRLALGAGICALLACLLFSSYKEAHKQAALEADNLSQMLETRLNGTLQEAQDSLQDIASHLESAIEAESTSLESWQLRSLALRYPAAGHFDVLSADGSFVTRSDTRPQVITDELERFRGSLAQQTSNPSMALGAGTEGEQLYLAVPVVDISRRIRGWISTSKPLKELIEGLSKINVGTHGVITIRRTDQPQTILRIPSRTSYPRKYRADGIDHFLAQGIKEGSLSMRSRVDGVERRYSFKQIGNLPMVAAVGLAQQDYLADWKSTGIACIAVCAVLYGLIIALSMRVQAQRAHRLQVAEELRESAFQDKLTGLPNRHQLLEHVGQAIAEYSGRELTLVYFDVDNFKSINESLGHITGDEILKCLAHRLEALKPSVATVARVSGDEFLILVHDGDAVRIAQLVKRILHYIRQPVIFDGYNLSISISAGIACYPRHGVDFGTLLKAADSALAQAKRNGRNTWAFYEATMGARELRFLEIQSELRSAFERNQLQIFYQPQIDLLSDRVIGVEALLRWNHATHGHIPPLEFIAVAEAIGLIVPIGDWVLKEVCAQAMAWQAAGLGNLSVAINCSAVQFRQGNLVQQVRCALVESGLSPRLLDLEMTESILMEQSEQLIEIMRGLKALGVRMSIDDFGTGYSSLSYLKRFAVDKLKIDQSFVRGMLANAQDEAIVRAIITLGHSFGMTVVAEGVENAEIRNALVTQGCDHAQGYFYAKALNAQEFEKFLKDRC